MTEQLKQIADTPCRYGEEEGGINLIDFWRVIRKRRKMIGWIVAVTIVMVAAVSFCMTDIYRAQAIIIPVAARDSGGGGSASLGALVQQFGGLPGISMSPAGTASEIVSLLNSNILREKVIRQYNLMPILFYNKWDAKQQTWKPGYTILGVNLLNIPDTWDALRLLEEIVRINRNIKDNTITISVDFHDPGLAARIVDYYLATLTNYMSSETKRVAATNRKYLEEQLGSTADPFIKQKTYNMIAQQIEMGMMAEVKENFAFKIIDPPLAPDKAIKPKRGQMILLSMIMALFIGICLAFFLEYLEKVKMKNGEAGI